MRDSFDGSTSKVYAYFSVVPFVVRFILSWLFLNASDKVSDPVVSYALSSALNAVSWVLPFGTYYFLSDTKKRILSVVKPHKPVLVFFSAYFTATMLSIAYSYLLLYFGCDVQRLDFSGFTIAHFVIFCISSVILVPISEEFAFRRILLYNLLPFGRIPAIIISAVMFALCHHPASYVYSCVFGIALAVVSFDFGWKRSLVLHMANNLISCIYIILEQCVSETFYDIACTIRFVIMTVLGVYCTIKLSGMRCRVEKNS